MLLFATLIGRHSSQFGKRAPAEYRRQEASVSESYVIEIRPSSSGRTLQAGIVVRDRRGFRFFAALDAFATLERKLFRHPKAAEEAALRCIADFGSRRSGSSSGKPAGRGVGTTMQLTALC